MIEGVNAIKYLGLILFRYGWKSGERETRETCIIEEQQGFCMYDERQDSKEDRMLANETLIWSEGQRSKIQAFEISYLSGVCGLNRMDGESSDRSI